MMGGGRRKASGCSWLGSEPALWRLQLRVDDGERMRLEQMSRGGRKGSSAPPFCLRQAGTIATFRIRVSQTRRSATPIPCPSHTSSAPITRMLDRELPVWIVCDHTKSGPCVIGSNN